jgi:hypothetical protein
MREAMNSGWRRRTPQRFPVHYAIVIRRQESVVETGILSDLGLQDAWGSASVPLLVGEACVLRFSLRPNMPCLSFPALIRVTEGRLFRAQLACPDARATYALVEWIRERRRVPEPDAGLAFVTPRPRALGRS